MSRRERREFKLQMVKLYNSGKPTAEIVIEYDLKGTNYKLVPA